MGVQYHTDRTRSVYVENFNRFIGATAHDNILKNVKDKVIDRFLQNQAELDEEEVVFLLNDKYRKIYKKKDTRMKSVNGRETGYLVSSFLLKNLNNLVPVIGLVSVKQKIM